MVAIVGNIALPCELLLHLAPFVPPPCVSLGCPDNSPVKTWYPCNTTHVVSVRISWLGSFHGRWPCCSTVMAGRGQVAALGIFICRYRIHGIAWVLLHDISGSRSSWYLRQGPPLSHSWHRLGVATSHSWFKVIVVPATGTGP